MFKKLLLVSFIFLSIISFSQEKKVNGNSGATSNNSNKKTFKGTVNGKIIDENTRENLAYTNVSLTNLETKKVVEGTVTGEKGKFNFKDIITGKYKISISFIGYTTKELEFELTGSKPDYKFKKILLTPSSETISEIEINETKAIYENKIDKWQMALGQMAETFETKDWLNKVVHELGIVKERQAKRWLKEMSIAKIIEDCGHGNWRKTDMKFVDEILDNDIVLL